ncbi:MAG TPA: phosphoglucosamine mutase, partial [Clostridia bacterium]|nr:phosphoglucosamine mutase [Clostridia bacterium]
GLQLLSVMVRSGKPLSELSSIVKSMPQVLSNIRINSSCRDRFKEDTELFDQVKAKEEQLAGKGRILIRLSGTEPLVRVMVEGTDAEEIDEIALELSKIIEARFGE